MVFGACKAFSYGKHAKQCPGAFAYRFNRRFDLADLVVHLIVDVSRGAAIPERVIRRAWFRFESGDWMTSMSRGGVNLWFLQPDDAAMSK